MSDNLTKYFLLQRNKSYKHELLLLCPGDIISNLAVNRGKRDTNWMIVFYCALAPVPRPPLLLRVPATVPAPNKKKFISTITDH